VLPGLSSGEANISAGNVTVYIYYARGKNKFARYGHLSLGGHVTLW